MLGVAAGSDFTRGAVNRGVAYESDLPGCENGNSKTGLFSKNYRADARCRLSGSAGYTAWKTNCDQFKLWKCLKM